MATKSIITRIKNKVDTLAKWQSYTGTLLDGEIAIVRVLTGETYVNPVTGADEPVVELLMKVGDGNTSFANLPWMSAKASDVYDWAKATTVVFNENNYHLEFRAADNSVVAYADLTDIDTRLDALETGKLSDISVSQVSSGVVKSIEKDGTGGIKVTRAAVAAEEIADSAVTTAKIANTSITTAKIADGAVTNAKLSTGISSDKINVGTGTTDGTLSKKLADMTAAIAANTSKLPGHDDEDINDLIDNKISELNVSAPTASGTGTAFITSVSQTDGKISATKANLPTANASTAGITKLYTSLGTSTDGTVTSKVVNDINTQVETNKTDIAALKTAVAGGVHFVGTVTAKPTTASITVNGSATPITAAAGDVVIWSTEGIEYIYTGSAWEELGDVNRIGAVETAISNMDYNGGDFGTSKFATKVTQADGKVTVEYAQPVSTDIKHGDSTVNAKLGDIDTQLANKSDKDHTHPAYVNQNAFSNIKVGSTTVAADSATDTVEFVGTNVTITPDTTDGTVTFAVADGTTSVKGIVQLSDATNSDVSATAATSKAVKAAYDKGVQGVTDAAAALAAAQHSHTAYENQNAFSTIKVGSTNVEADTVKDTVEFTGTNVTITPDATNDKITFAVADGSTSAKGVVQLNNTVTSTSTSLAATANSVKTAYDKGAEGAAAAAEIAANYVKINDDNNLVNQAGDVIIFDCGGAGD